MLGVACTRHDEGAVDRIINPRPLSQRFIPGSDERRSGSWGCLQRDRPPTAREKATLGRAGSSRMTENMRCEACIDSSSSLSPRPRGLATFLATIFAHGNNCRTASTGFLHSYDGALTDWAVTAPACNGHLIGFSALLHCYVDQPQE
jgi:hypothetical protein